MIEALKKFRWKHVDRKVTQTEPVELPQSFSISAESLSRFTDRINSDNEGRPSRDKRAALYVDDSLEGLLLLRERMSDSEKNTSGPVAVVLIQPEMDQRKQRMVYYIVGPSSVYPPELGLRCKRVIAEGLTDNAFHEEILSFLKSFLDFDTNISRSEMPHLFERVLPVFTNTISTSP